MANRIHIVGRKNSGKTTLIVELVSQLTQLGHRVGTIKHTHHHHELDVPGKDSFRHRQAGAAAVGVLAPTMNAVFWPVGAVEHEETGDRYAAMMRVFHECDIVLVEGDSRTAAPKIEVWRAATQTEPLAGNDKAILALVTDDPVQTDVPVRGRSDVADLASWILALARE